jgi:uncharacterized protein (DUF2252 family)
MDAKPNDETIEATGAPAALPHLAESERVALGKAARTIAPRSTQDALDVDHARDPIALLEQQGRSRVPELLPIRYGRMLASPFAFFRGAAVVMAHDLATTASPGLRAQLSGDAHLLNFGGYASPERDLVFDLNDFDETLAGPFEWDVKRLATSFELAARERAFQEADRADAVTGVVRAYREAIRRFATMGDLEVWYARLDAGAVAAELAAGHDAKLAKTFEHSVARAQANDGKRALASLTHRVGGELRFVSEPPLIVPLRELFDNDQADDLEAQIRSIYRVYRHSLPHDRRTLLERFRYVDLARKVVGVGSVGTRCWMMLMLGRDENDPLLLQIKEAEPSVLEPLLGGSRFANHGQRVVEGQRLMQATSDIFLGWSHAAEGFDGPRDYYVRQLRDWKSSVDLQSILPSGLAAYAKACGWTLARAHARSGDRIALAAYLGGSDRFDRAVARFASSYADLSERDHQSLVRAVSDGRITAVEL